MRKLLAVALFFCVVFPLRAEEPKATFNVLIVTGGHGFDQPNFYKMFDEMPSIRYDKAEVPKDMNLLAPGLEKKYDLVLTYDMNNFPAVTKEQREQYAALVKSGMPLIVMHHSLCGYDNWYEYIQMVGGQYLHKPIEIDGKPYPTSTYKHDIDMNVQVVDKAHPITKRVDNFTIHDEGYNGIYVQKGVNLLLKTDHTDASPEVAWTNRYGKGVVFAIALGHDKHAFENPNLRLILRQGIQWCVEEAQKNK